MKWMPRQSIASCQALHYNKKGKLAGLYVIKKKRYGMIKIYYYYMKETK